MAGVLSVAETEVAVGEVTGDEAGRHNGGRETGSVSRVMLITLQGEQSASSVVNLNKLI